MSPLTDQVATMFETLTEHEQTLVYELIQRLAPDDIASQEDIADITAARMEYQRGETIDASEIHWN